MKYGTNIAFIFTRSYSYVHSVVSWLGVVCLMRAQNQQTYTLLDRLCRSPFNRWFSFSTRFLLSVTLFAIPHPLAAAEGSSTGLPAELELLKQEESVSVASRQEQRISEAPANVYVITDEDILRSGVTDLPTILRRIPGMEVTQMNGADFNVSVRGDNQVAANKLLVMVDGRSIYIDAQGIVLWKLLPVTLSEIKRIEVLKGPASVLYGFNAFDGIINIITKSPEEMKGTTLQFGGGNVGTLTASAIQAGTVDKFGYRLSIGTNQNASWTNHDALAFRDYLFNIKTEYAISSLSKLTVSGGLVDSNRWDGPLQQDIVVALKPSQAYTHLTYQHSDLLIHAYWNRFDAPSVQQFNAAVAPFQTITGVNGSQASPTLADTYNVDFQHSLNFSSMNRFTYGVNYRYNTLSSDFISQDSHEHRLGLYIQDEWKLAKPVTLVAGVRTDLDTFINPTYSPRVALVYNPIEEHTFRLSGSVAYRPPTLFERNANVLISTKPPLPPTTSSIVGGAGPSPEEIVSYEAEYQGWYFKHRLRARTAVFYSHISDLIIARRISPTIVTLHNDPGTADIFGTEIGAEFLVTTWLSALANYSYQSIHQSFEGSVQRAGPHNKFNVGLRGDWDNGLNAEATYHYYGSVIYPPGASFSSLAQAGLITLPNPAVGSYNLLNLRGGYRFWQQMTEAGYMRDAEVAASVFNALNDGHNEYPIGETIGRRVMAWLTLRY